MTTDCGQLTSRQRLNDLVDSIFPFTNNQLIYAFGYGSGVFSQGRDPGMLDMILVVQDAQAFHAANQMKNPYHYATWLRTMDPEGYLAAGLQRRFLRGRDGKILFHVCMEEQQDNDDNNDTGNHPIRLKYGVIQYEDFIQDLTQWESLYVAGRLHKPTLSLLLPPHYLHQTEFQQSIQQAHVVNLQAAVAAAMLLSPLASTSISWLNFYSQIAALSYTGDFRMQIGGEDPQKIQKLVQTPGQLERFHTLYRDGDSVTSMPSILKPLEQLGLLSIGTEGLEWDPYDVAVRTQWIQKLPPVVKKPLLLPSTTTSRHGNSNSNSNINITRNPLQNHLIQQQQTLSKVLESIVAPAARYQSFKGLLTFGVRKSIQYASAKLSKGLFRKR